MCGIVGALAQGTFEDEKMEKLRQNVMIFIVTELLQLTQARGKDATGLAALFEDGNYMGLKMGVSAQEFVTRFGGKKTDYDGFVKVWREKKAPAKIVIGHCRKPSTAIGAGAEDNNNNHPIKVGNIVGIHNGTLTNHEKIFNNLGCGRDSKVDSEAIFRLMDHLTDNGKEPFTEALLQEVCKRLHGNYSVLAFNGNNPFQLAGFRDGRPMEFALIKPLKLFLTASDKDYLKIAITRYNKMAFIYQPGVFTELRKDDVEFGSTLDDSLFLFDITKDVDENTRISDLYTTAKVPRTNKIWSKSSPNVGANTNKWNHQNNNRHVAGNKKTTITVSKPSTADKKAKMLGMAWRNSTKSYERISDAVKKTAETHKSVILDVDAGTITDIAGGVVLVDGGEKKSQIHPKILTSCGGRKHSMQESDLRQLTGDHSPCRVVTGADGSIEIQRATPIGLADTSIPLDDDVIQDGPATITVAEVQSRSPKERIDGGPKKRVRARPSTRLAEEVEAIEKALAATAEVSNFSCDDEMADALEILDAEAMRTMPSYSLGNRIKKYFFKSGWFAGYMACKAEAAESKTAATNVDVYAREKLSQVRRSSSATIRAIKVITDILASSIGCKQEAIGQVVETTKNAIKDGKEVNLSALEKAFRPGDRKRLPAIDTAIEVMRISAEENNEAKADDTGSV